VTGERPGSVQGHDPVQGPWDLDRDLIADAIATERPLCAVYPHPDICAVIGHGGDPWIETRPELLAADGIPLRRRRGGGCAVVLDPGNLVCSVAWPLAGIAGITGAFATLSRILAAALAERGFPDLAQEGTSDLAHHGCKLGGSCIWRTRGVLYYSTTLLVDPDWELIERYLPHPPREPEYRQGRPHRDFLTSLRQLGHSGPPTSLAGDLSVILSPQVASLPLNPA
jgi:lipoate-protein ligase A